MFQFLKASLSSWMVLIFACCRSEHRASAQFQEDFWHLQPVTGTVVLSLGPAADADFTGTSLAQLLAHSEASLFSAELLEEVRRVVQVLEADLPSSTGLEHCPASPTWTETFDASQGHIRIEFALSCYRAQAGNVPEQLLRVELIGRTLMIRGRHSDGHVLRSFQRSFHLPSAADADGVSVMYDQADGNLLVNIPLRVTSSSLRPNAHTQSLAENYQQAQLLAQLDSLESGSQATITVMGSETTPGESGFLSAFLKMLTNMDKQDSSSPQTVTRKPMVLRTKDAQPFWRLADEDTLGNKTPMLEVVVPPGVDLGLAQGMRIPTYNNMNATLRGTQVEVGEVRLPIHVDHSHCTWANDKDKDHLSLRIVGLTAFTALTCSLCMIIFTWSRNFGRITSFRRSKMRPTMQIMSGIAILLLGVLALGLTVIVHMTYKQSRLFDERVWQCGIMPEAVKKLDIQVANEL